MWSEGVAERGGCDTAKPQWYYMWSIVFVHTYIHAHIYPKFSGKMANSLSQINNNKKKKKIFLVSHQ